MKPTRSALPLVVLVVLALAALACSIDLGLTPPTPQVIYVPQGETPVPQQQQQQEQPPQNQPAVPPSPTWTPIPQVPTNTPTQTPIPEPVLVAGQELSCAVGPDWQLFQVIDIVRAGERVTVLGRAPSSWSDYYFVRRDSGSECWVWGGNSQLEGNVAGLPERAAPAIPNVTLTLRNSTGYEVCYLFIREEGTGAWGNDRLGTTETLTAGETFSISLRAGWYDVLAEDCGHNDLFIGEDILANAGGNLPYQAPYVDMVLNQAAPAPPVTDVTFSLTNHQGVTVWYVYISPHDSPDWGPDLLGADTIPDGGVYWFTLPEGYYDFLIEDSGHNTLDETYNVYIGPGTTGFTTP